MVFNPGDVVFLKSGGQAMTVVKVEGDGVECIWISEEGKFFREKLPLVALMRSEDVSDEDEEDEDKDEGKDEDEGKSPNRRRT
jgi:uncharacterized protein YodC (DUF2158 family)